MSNSTIVALDQVTPDQMDFWNEHSEKKNFTFKAPLTDDNSELSSLLQIADFLVVKNKALTKEILSLSPNVKFIQKMGRLIDNIDFSATKARNIPAAYLPLPGCSAVAEHTIALMLACAKKIVTGHDMTVKGSYRDLGVEPKITTERSHGFQWMKIPGLEELNGLTLGIYGYGEIGNEVARRMKAFNMNILYFKRTPFSKKYEQDLGISYADKETLFKESDFITVHSPLTDQTDKSIGSKEFDMMKESAFIVNVSRGGVINEPDLVDALKKKKIAGAGLDVFVQEPIPYDHPYLNLENITLSPHIAGGKGGARLRQTESVINNIAVFADNGTPDYLIP